jgi:signal transduction histidine kinase
MSRESASAAASREPGLAAATKLYRSGYGQAALFVVAGGLSLWLGLSASASLLHGLNGYPWPLRAADAVFGAIAYVGLWWRARYPLTFAGYVLVVGVFSTLVGALSFIAAFNVAVHRRWPTALITSTLLAVSAWPSVLLYETGRNPQRGVLMLLIIVVTFAVTGWGMFVRARRELLGSLRERAERAEESREQHAAHARIAERQRMAREMHDVLAHRLSLLSVQAGALEFSADSSPGEVADAAGAIRATTHQALQELRSVVRVLREEDENNTGAPQPVAADVPALVAESDAVASVSASYGSIDLGKIPDDVGRTLYRIVQEGLTNARKHAPASAVDVRLSGTPPEGLSLAITSWLPVDRAARATAPGSGTGLIGLRERAVLAGGRLDVAVTDDDRFQLLVWLPWEGA